MQLNACYEKNLSYHPSNKFLFLRFRHSTISRLQELVIKGETDLLSMTTSQQVAIKATAFGFCQ